MPAAVTVVSDLRAMASAADPFLNVTARVPAHRYEPSTWSEYLAAVYVLWNLLDKNMQTRNKKAPISPYGFMRPVQLHAYGRFLWDRPRLRTYCETGVNGGHGTAAALLANPKLRAISFDFGGYSYSQPAYDLLALYFGARFAVHRGDSRQTLTQFAAQPANRGACDVLLVDGSHTRNGASADLRNFRRVAACNATVFVDDLDEGPGEAFREAAAAGWLRVDEWNAYPGRDRANNPCTRGPSGGLRCPKGDGWGWGRATLVGAHACG